MIRISGRFRQTSTQIPAGTLTKRRFEILISARRRPKISEKTIPISGDLEVDQEALDQEAEVVARPEPLPVARVEQVTHRAAHRLIANRLSRYRKTSVTVSVRMRKPTAPQK